MINFILPGWCTHTIVNLNLCNLMESHKDWFYPNVQIAAFYDSFANNLFGGGRVEQLHYPNMTLKQLENIQKIFNDECNVSLRIICSNNIVNQSLLKDNFTNEVLSLFHNSKNSVIIGNNIELEQYIQLQYPNFTLISSTTKCINNFNFLLKELQNNKYKVVCLDFNFNKNIQLLSNIPNNLRNKCEFLCNDFCKDNCEFRKYHYNHVSQVILNQTNDIFHCPYHKETENFFLPEIQKEYKNQILINDIINTYVPLGFNFFKLQGRQFYSHLSLALTYANYMVQPQYKDAFLYEILQKV